MTDILLSAFLLSVVLLGIHSFFGLEIIKRGIIFTDLAIGQMAAVGAAVSLLFFNGEYLDPISLAFALLGGALIAVAARRTDSHEAFIGLLYAFGLSAVFILLSKSSHGMETFQKLMASDILFTPLAEIAKTAVVYAVLGLVLLLFYRRARGFARESLFFVTFAITVTLAVRLAGVLVVFALLVAPAILALRLRKGVPLVNAWIIGTIVNLIAIVVSYNFDFPTGYTLVCLHAFLALTGSLVLPARRAALPQERT
jgi:zinc/manganese transport system permease protein